MRNSDEGGSKRREIRRLRAQASVAGGDGREAPRRARGWPRGRGCARAHARGRERVRATSGRCHSLQVLRERQSRRDVESLLKSSVARGELISLIGIGATRASTWGVPEAWASPRR